MDFSFHIEQGQHLLEKQDGKSMKKALEHFKAANEMTDEESIGKPKTLYFLALGNFIIGNIEYSYRIAHKAIRSIEPAIRSSIFSMNNMRQVLGEDNINALIERIDQEYPQLVTFTDTEDDEFDENKLDFTILNRVYGTTEDNSVKPQFSLNSLSEELLMAVFTGLSRTNDQLIYFDKLKGDVLRYGDGYFSSYLGDQSVENRKLYNKIVNSEPTDFVDEDRYFLIDRLRLVDFLAEYQNQSKGKEPFSSFAKDFAVEVLKEFKHNQNLTVDNLANSEHIQEKFHEHFNTKYHSQALILKNDYQLIFINTCKALSTEWIKDNVLESDSNAL